MNKEQKPTVTEKPSDMLLACVVTRGKGSQLMNLLRRESASYAVSTFAEGTIPPSHILNMLGIAKTKKELVFAFINREIEETCYQSLAHEMKLDQTGHGVAFQSHCVITRNHRQTQNWQPPLSSLTRAEAKMCWICLMNSDCVVAR